MTSKKRAADENLSLKASAEQWLAPSRSDQTETDSLDIVNAKGYIQQDQKLI